MRHAGGIHQIKLNPLKVAWVSDFPMEWMSELPEELRDSPRRHPATWQRVLLSELQKDASIQLHVISLRHRIKRPFTFERGGSMFYVLKCPPWLRVASVFWADTILIRRLLRHIRPNLVHAWGMEKGAGLIGSRLGYPYVMTVQGLFAWYKEQLPLPAYDYYIERLERFSLPRAPVVTTEASFAVSYLKARFPQMRVHHAEHAPSRVFFEVKRKPKTIPVHFLSVGTLGFRKGTDLLLKALDKLCPTMAFSLTVISSPNPRYLDSLRCELSSALWPRIQFKHDLIPLELAAELAATTILLLPTRGDVSPNTVKEAVVAGVPVVVSDVGGVRDYVSPGQNGFLFPSGDLDAFVEAIKAAVSHPLFRRGEVEESSLTKYREYLSPGRMAENFMRAYHDAAHFSQST